MENYQNYSIITFNGEVTTILLLQNKIDISICTTNGFLYIYNIKLIKPKLSIKLINSTQNITNETILDIIEYKINNFCLSCWDATIKIIELYDDNTKYKINQILYYIDEYVNSLKKLFFYKNEIVIASSCNIGKIKLWKYENEKFNIYKQIKLYDDTDDFIFEQQVESLEESTKYHELVCGNYHSKVIFFCNLNNVQQIQKMDISVNRCIRALKIIENGEILIVAGNREINIIKLENKLILTTIKFDFECEFNCVFQKKNGNLLITEFGNICKIREFKFDIKNLSLITLSMRENDFKNYITTIIELDNGDLIIGGYDKIIKCFENPA